jgi:prepilin-type processing-associated H-X9-DG protein
MRLAIRRLNFLRIHGFSLLELLITMALMIIMYCMMMSRGSKSYQEMRKAECARNLQALHVALKLYAQDHNGVLPAVTGAATSEVPLSRLVPRYTSTTAPFICPGSKDPRLPEAISFEQAGKISYAYYMGRRMDSDPGQPLLTDRQVDTSAKTAGQTIFSPNGKKPGANHHKHGGNLLFPDGHVEAWPSRAMIGLPLKDGVILLNTRE